MDSQLLDTHIIDAVNARLANQDRGMVCFSNLQDLPHSSSVSESIWSIRHDAVILERREERQFMYQFAPVPVRRQFATLLRFSPRLLKSICDLEHKKVAKQFVENEFLIPETLVEWNRGCKMGTSRTQGKARVGVKIRRHLKQDLGWQAQQPSIIRLSDPGSVCKGVNTIVL